MKKINYLMSMFAIVLALGVMSCDPNENVTPTQTLEQELVGSYVLTSSIYNGVETLATNPDFENGNDVGFSGAHYNFTLNADGTGTFKQLTSNTQTITWTANESTNSLRINKSSSITLGIKELGVDNTKFTLTGGTINTYNKF